jgi:hypothetical protein
MRIPRCEPGSKYFRPHIQNMADKHIIDFYSKSTAASRSDVQCLLFVSVRKSCCKHLSHPGETGGAVTKGLANRLPRKMHDVSKKLFAAERVTEVRKAKVICPDVLRTRDFLAAGTHVRTGRTVLRICTCNPVQCNFFYPSHLS